MSPAIRTAGGKHLYGALLRGTNALDVRVRACRDALLMKTYPPIPRLAAASDHWLDTGHLWLLEKIDGAHLRFRLERSGLVRFGDRNRVYDDPESVPEPYRHAVRHVRERLDRDALRRAVDDVESVVFFGEATHHHTIQYDWDRTPSVLGFDVWSADAEAFLPPDAAEQIFEGIGLHPVNAIERERHTRDFDPDSYAVPQSAWYDGPAEGVVVRDKRGNRAKLLHPDVRERDETAPADASESELAAEYATRRRFEAVAAELRAENRAVTFEAVYERTLETIAREAHRRLYGGRESVDVAAFRSEVAALTRAFLDDIE